MRNTKILIWTIIVSAFLLTNSSYVSASEFDCQSVNKDTYKEILEKNKNWEELSSDEQSTLDEINKCWLDNKKMWNRSWMDNENMRNRSWTDNENIWNRPWMDNENTWNRSWMNNENMKENKEILDVIIEKKNNNEELTTEESEIYNNFINKEEKTKENVSREKWDKEWINKNDAEKKVKNNREVKNISTEVKTSITNTLSKAIKNYSHLSNEEKIEKYTQLQINLEIILEKSTSTTNISDTKKETYQNIINELLNQLDDLIIELS